MGLRETETKKTETRWYHADKRPSIAKGKQKNKDGSNHILLHEEED